MASKTFVFICVQMILFNAVYTQVLNRVVPSVLPFGESLYQNQLLFNSIAPNLVQIGPNVVPIAPNVVPIGPQVVPIAPNGYPIAPNVVAPNPYNVETIFSAPVSAPAPTVIQDSSVANNLANALQLLVVSSLLSNTLPTMGDVVVPSYAAPAPVEVVSPVPYGGLNGYNYVY